ncbi:molybdopterin adenylyltransferase [Caloramator fervidus]|uniref:Molybdopterin adenylyltransferase n=1 Tax=Caloramator fervidus TaxID=29344 RepID=A0A1H5WAZ2_9CLOT|nr:MogA/MoaB family molybdenum cofactor biosynthesis protein [Caloramator fervidus]SEF96426.1 molybdopterin adenylyltransferase [Caloramator fervidus]
MIKVAILTVSDKGYKGEREDTTSLAIKDILDSSLYEVQEVKIVPDEIEDIKRELVRFCDELKVDLVLTNGGTGFSKRDVTPEATLAVVEKLVPGIPEAMRAKSLEITPKAMLSRAVAGIRNKTLIINLPGSPKGACESLSVVLPALKHGIEILKGEASECARKDD